MQGLGPCSLHGMDPQEQHVGGLRIGEYTVGDPAIGIDVSAGERQQRRDGERFLAVEILGQLRDLTTRPDPFAIDPEPARTDIGRWSRIAAADGLIWINGLEWKRSDRVGGWRIPHGHDQIGRFDGTGNIPAALNRSRHVSWAAPNCRICDRRDGVHAGRGRDTWTTRKLRHSALVQIDLLQPVRIHDRL